MKFCWITRSFSVLLLAGCQQSAGFPSRITASVDDAKQVIVEGDLELVTYEADGGEVVTLDYSEDDVRPKGTLYPDFLVIVDDKTVPLPRRTVTVPGGESRIETETLERTTDVIPTRLVTSIKFFNKGNAVMVEP